MLQFGNSLLTDPASDAFREALRLAKSTRHIHSNWYLRTYPDVAATGLEPAVHYLRYGAAMGRNPGTRFDTRFYLETYPDAAESGLNPLVHYARHGREKGYLTAPEAPAKPNFFEIRRLMLSMGLAEKAVAMLQEILDGHPLPAMRARAAMEIALWHFRLRSEEGYRAALGLLEQAAGIADTLEMRRRLLVLRLICLHHLNEPEAGLALYEQMAALGLSSPDGMLAVANLQKTPESRLEWINGALAASGIAPMALLPDDGRPVYDRLAPRDTLPAITEGPKVTVLLAAYDAGPMIGTALRSLQDQTWKNLEIIVIDDCSPTMDTHDVATGFAATDPRIRVLRMERNGGAYVARNHGLDLATGDYVTLHDADDWSHPSKIETQVRYMEAHPEVMGCTSEQVRCTDDLIVGKPRGGGLLVMFNTSSFLWRREPVRAALGYWDTVRFGADSEFMRRMQIAFGQDSVVKLSTGILSLQREAETSVTTDPVKGLDGSGVFYGVRKEYREAQDHHHATAASLKYTNDPDRRPFPVPPMMNLPGEAGYDRAFDVVICGDFRDGNPGLGQVLDRIETHLAEGRSVGLTEMNSGEHEEAIVSPRIRALINAGRVQMTVYGERVQAGLIERMGEALPTTYAPTLLTAAED